MTNAPRIWAILIAASHLLATTAFADIFRYKDGRVISGTVRSAEQEKIGDSTVNVWAVEVDAGVFVRVLESELEHNGYEPLSEARKQYERNITNLPQTAENHIAMAGECTRLGLTDLAHAHFLRALDIDPDNRAARSGAGYDRDANGRWVKKQKVMGELRGKVMYKGRWRFPESVAIEQNKEAAKQQLAEATKDIVRWHNTVLTSRGSRFDEAMRGLQQVDNPLAIGTLVDFLLDTRKPAPPPLKMLYVRKLAQFQVPAAAAGLARASMLDPTVRVACFDALSNYGREAAIPIFISFLRSDDNNLVNIAAEGLGQLNAHEAVLPLIEALVTTHTQEVGSDGMSASPTSGSFSVGSKKTVKVDVPNQSVLGTLSQLTGQSFRFDKQSWLAWYASVHAPPALDLRRDRD